VGEVVLCVGISHSKSVVTVQRAFRANYAKDPPTDRTMPKGTDHRSSEEYVITRVWQELEYRIDVCRFTRGAHIEHLQLSK